MDLADKKSDHTRVKLLTSLPLLSKSPFLAPIGLFDTLQVCIAHVVMEEIKSGEI